MLNPAEENGDGDAVSTIAESPLPNQVEERLEEECNRLEEELKELQSQLNEARQPIVIGAGDPLLAIYGAKEKQLKAEISVRQHAESPVVSEVYTEPLMLHKLEETNSQLQELVKFTKEQLADLKRENGTNSSSLSELEQTQQALQQQLGRVSEQDGLGPRQADILHRLKDKEKKTAVYYKDLMKEMARFTDEHFPIPSSEAVKRFRKKMPTPGLKLSENVIPLKSIIEILMNRSMEAIHDPYVPITGAFWPPFVELLLRTGIAQRHSTEEKLIKLTPFHL